MKSSLLVIILLVSPVVYSLGQSENKINVINNGMPNRISMNMTVTKQTQSATFGEKVKTGIVDGGCVVLFPNSQSFRLNSSQNTITEMSSSEVVKVNAGLHAAGSAISQGASLVGGALPGGAIISAAVSKVGVERPIWEVRDPGNEFQLPSDLTDGEYDLMLTLDAGPKNVAKMQVQFGILVEKGTYKVVSANSKHDTAKNSINNVR
jgi:hypothetical protein